MKQRVLSVILAALLVTSMVFSLISCESDDESSIPAQSEADKNDFFGLNIPEGTDFGGKTVRVLTTATVESGTAYQIQPESNPLYNSESTTAVISAIAECTRQVEERLNIDIEEECIFTFSRYGGDMYKKIFNDAMAFTADYQFVMPCLIEAAMLAQDGLLYDLNRVPNINLNNEWWAQSFNETVSVANKVYFASNDITVVSKDATMFVAFNKKMAETYRITEKYGYENLYQMVDSKAWTQDVMYEMAKSVYQDTNKNHRCDLGDINGMSGQIGTLYWNLIAGGEHVVTKDENDLPVLTLKNERAISIIEDAQDYFTDPQSGYICADDYFSQSAVPVADLMVPEFKADRCLFFYNCLTNLTLIRDMESDFGVLPPPIYDSTQDNYISSIGAWTSNCVAIPTSVTGDDVALAGMVIEALAAVSKSELNPVYYEQTLQYQIARDEDSMRMLDIIFANRSPELSEVYQWGNITQVMYNMIKAKKGTFVSAYESAEQATQLAIEETIAAFTKGQ